MKATLTIIRFDYEASGSVHAADLDASLHE